MIELEEYLLVLKQDGEGCDYTIGCGYTHKKILLPSNNEELKLQKLKEATVEYYGSDSQICDAYLIPMSNVIALPIGDWYWEQEVAAQKTKEERTKKEELRQLEILKKKYENG